LTFSILREAVKFSLTLSLKGIEPAVPCRYNTPNFQNSEPITDVAGAKTARRIAVIFRGVLSKYLQHRGIDPNGDTIVSPVRIGPAVVRLKVVKDLVDVKYPGGIPVRGSVYPFQFIVYTRLVYTIYGH
jgi:hypothetical protein